MSKYFFIANGPRGCYLPDSGFIARCDTRRELKACLEGEARALRDAGFIGLSRRSVASLSAALWKEANKPRPTWREFVIPAAPSHARGNYCYALGASVSSRREFVEQGEN